MSRRFARATAIIAGASLLAGMKALPVEATNGQHDGRYTALYTSDAAVITAQESVGDSRELLSGKKSRSSEVRNRKPSESDQYRLTLACGYRRVAEVSGSEDAGACTNAMTACTFRTPPSEGPLYLLWQRPTRPPNQPWQLAGEYCGAKSVPPGIAKPPPVPSLGDIQRAFRALPFSKPTVSIQPAGNITLVNLPTYFQATWPNDATLQPGDLSHPIQLLSWSVQFKVAAHTYDFHYGDGASSGAVTDAGGTYPDGAIRHTYTSPNAHAHVFVDATLTGQFRANGGPWVDLDTIAHLQNAPLTTLQVKEAPARLVTR